MRRFGDDPIVARRMLDLVRQGRKTATSGLLEDWQVTGRSLPRPGMRWLLVDDSGRPGVLVELTSVEVRPFEEVDGAFCCREGFASPQQWKDVHRQFFDRERRRLGLEAEAETSVVCIEFRRVGDDQG